MASYRNFLCDLTLEGAAMSTVENERMLGITLRSSTCRIETTAHLIHHPNAEEGVSAYMSINIPGQGAIYAYVYGWKPSADIQAGRTRTVCVILEATEDGYLRAVRINVHDGEGDNMEYFIYEEKC